MEQPLLVDSVEGGGSPGDGVQKRILLVDDRDHSRRLMVSELEEAGFAVSGARDGIEAWSLFQSQIFECVVTDVRMPNRNGMALLQQIRSPESANPRVPVVMVSAFGSLSTAVAAGRRGATDFYPLNTDGIERLVARVSEILRDTVVAAPPTLVGPGKEIAGIRERLATLAAVDVPLLIRGEAGTGRSSVAMYVHTSAGLGRDRPLRLDCHDRKTELPERLPTGCVYLSEVDRSSPELQATLWERLAGHRGTMAATDLRALASTQRDLRALADDGRFHPGLARWLSRFVIELPSLRERLADFESIAHAILAQTPKRHVPLSVRIGRRAMERLKQHPWRGNLAELEEVLERLVVFARSGTICESQVQRALEELEPPLERIAKQRARSEREHLLALYRKHGTFSGVARELGVTRNAAKYRFRKHDLLPASR